MTKKTTKQEADDMNSWRKLAKRLEISESTLDRLRKMPGAPEEPDDPKWPGYIAATRRRVAAGPDMESAKLAKLQAEAELKKIQVSQARGEVIPIDEIDELHAAVYGHAVSALRQRIENDLPLKAYGAEVPAIKAECRRIVDEILNGMQKAITDWSTKRDRKAREAAQAITDPVS